MPSILRETGADTEKSLIYNTIRPYAKANGREQKAGGSTASSQYSMVCVKWVEGETIGLYDADGFGDGKVFVSPMEQVIRIRTGETGEDAI